MKRTAACRMDTIVDWDIGIWSSGKGFDVRSKRSVVRRRDLRSFGSHFVVQNEAHARVNRFDQLYFLGQKVTQNVIYIYYIYTYTATEVAPEGVSRRSRSPTVSVGLA